MIIHPIEIKEEKQGIVVSAKIEWETQNVKVPETLWFRFPKKYKNYLEGNLNAFLVSLLLPAMFLGENMYIKGSISSKLEYNLREYQRRFSFWFPKHFKQIKIRCDRYLNSKSSAGKSVLSAFSGGMDSFYTLWKHLPENEPNKEFQITHTLFVHGFDIPLHDKKTYEITSKSYKELMDTLNIGMIPLTTNLKRFHDRLGLDWEFTHSSAVAGVALLFDKMVSRFYFPEDDTYDHTPPYGIHLATTHLLRTENFNVISDGQEASKLDKARILSQWPETYDRLRVCYEKVDGLKNCCRCNKCSEAMYILEMVGTLKKYSTFPLSIDRKNVRGLRRRKENLNIPRYMIKFAKITGRKDLELDYAYVYLMSKFKIWKESLTH